MRWTNLTFGATADGFFHKWQFVGSQSICVPGLHNGYRSLIFFLFGVFYCFHVFFLNVSLYLVTRNLSEVIPKLSWLFRLLFFICFWHWNWILRWYRRSLVILFYILLLHFIIESTYTEETTLWLILVNYGLFRRSWLGALRDCGISQMLDRNATMLIRLFQFVSGLMTMSALYFYLIISWFLKFLLEDRDSISFKIFLIEFHFFNHRLHPEKDRTFESLSYIFVKLKFYLFYIHSTLRTLNLFGWMTIYYHLFLLYILTT